MVYFFHIYGLVPEHLDQPDQHHGSEERDQKTIDIKSANSALAKHAHNPAAEDSADDTDHDVEYDALLGIGFHD